MARSKTPTWQPLKISTTMDEATGVWTARSRYYDAQARRHDIKRSGRTAGGAKLALQTAIRLAEQEAHRAKEEQEAEAVVALTVGELAESWLEARRPAPLRYDAATQAGTTPTLGLRVQTWEKYSAIVRDHILPSLGSLSVEELSTPDCEKAVHGLYDKSAGTGYRTAAAARQVLQQVFDYATRQGHRPDNPVRSVTKVPKLRKDPTRMSPETVRGVHEAVRSHHVEPGKGGPKPTSRLSDIVLLLAATGMRIGELLALRWQDVNVRSVPMTVTVSGTLVEQKSFFRQGYPKSSKSHRSIPLTEDWITSMILRRLENSQSTPTGAVFATRNGTFMRPSNFRTSLKKALGSADNFGGITPHSFRRTVASAVSEEFGDEAAAQLLGHASPQTTRDSYIQRPDVVPDFSAGLRNLGPFE